MLIRCPFFTWKHLGNEQEQIFDETDLKKNAPFLFAFRVRHSRTPAAFQCIFSYLEDPGLLKDKYGRLKY